MTQKRYSAQSVSDNTTDYARRIVHVPIIHSPADMGSMADGLASAIINRFGRRHWDEYLALLNGFWQGVREEIEGLALDYRKVDLYQDGLPVCGREVDIVRKIAQMGSENHQLLLDLMARGATLMGTEDPNLLLDEYRSIKNALKDDPGEAYSPARPVSDSRHKETLSKRDAYIGGRIDESLRPGRTGILFLGMMHNVEPFLHNDIVVTRLVQSGLQGRTSPRQGINPGQK